MFYLRVEWEEFYRDKVYNKQKLDCLSQLEDNIDKPNHKDKTNS